MTELYREEILHDTSSLPRALSLSYPCVWLGKIQGENKKHWRNSYKAAIACTEKAETYPENKYWTLSLCLCVCGTDTITLYIKFQLKAEDRETEEVVQAWLQQAGLWNCYEEGSFASPKELLRSSLTHARTWKHRVSEKWEQMAGRQKRNPELTSGRKSSSVGLNSLLTKNFI